MDDKQNFFADAVKAAVSRLGGSIEDAEAHRVAAAALDDKVMGDTLHEIFARHQSGENVAADLAEHDGVLLGTWGKVRQADTAEPIKEAAGRSRQSAPHVVEAASEEAGKGLSSPVERVTSSTPRLLAAGAGASMIGDAVRVALRHEDEKSGDHPSGKWARSLAEGAAGAGLVASAAWKR